MGVLDTLGGGKAYQTDNSSGWYTDAYGVTRWQHGGVGGAQDRTMDLRKGYVSDARGQDAGSREDQEWLEEQYRQRIAGNKPSIAEEQMRAQNMSNRAQQMAMARSGGGGALGSGAAVRSQQMATAQQDVQLGQSAALLRAQEQAAAEQGLGQLTSQKRAQDQGLMGAEMGYEAQAQDAYQRRISGEALAHESAAQRKGSGLGGLITTGGALIAGLTSDERAKTDVQDIDPRDIEAFLEASAGKRFRYRNGMGEPTDREYTSPMAQDLEESEIGQSLVREGDDGTKRIDVAHGYGAMLAAMAEMHDRLKRIEGGGKGGK